MTDNKDAPLEPGAVIGILGGGQLGRMTAQAAARLGYLCHIYCPDPESPAFQVTPLKTVAGYDDEAALTAFAQAVDVVTLEFENIPARAAEVVAERAALRPRPEILRICQNRLREKDFCNAAGVPTTRYAEVRGPEALERVARDIGRPCLLKTSELGYDGKGQVRIGPETAAVEAWAEMTGSAPGPAPVGVVEALVDFRLEVSVIVARGLDGASRTYPAVENRHKDQILDVTIAPARIPERVAERAEAIALQLAERLDLVGLLAIEMFVTQDDEVLVNELAPRPHNSGHWTLDACVTSQFEQAVRAVAGLPLGATGLLAEATMKNLIGDEVERWRELLADPNAKLHLYGKKEARPGRKMGHVTRLTPRG